MTINLDRVQKHVEALYKNLFPEEKEPNEDRKLMIHNAFEALYAEFDSSHPEDKLPEYVEVGGGLQPNPMKGVSG